MNLSDLKYPVSLSLRLDWSEMDLFGHINNVMYFKYLQASRVHYWEQVGLGQPSEDTAMGPLLAATSCDFKKPLCYPGLITVRASVRFIKNTSFGLHHQVWNESGELAAEGNDVIVLFDYKKGQKISMPDALRKQIEALEGRSYPSATNS